MDSNMQIGPGTPCSTCGGIYGDHYSDCSYNSQKIDRQNTLDRSIGRLLLAAIKAKDELAIGRLVRGQTP